MKQILFAIITALTALPLCATKPAAPEAATPPTAETSRKPQTKDTDIAKLEKAARQYEEKAAQLRKQGKETQAKVYEKSARNCRSAIEQLRRAQSSVAKEQEGAEKTYNEMLAAHQKDIEAQQQSLTEQLESAQKQWEEAQKQMERANDQWEVDMKQWEEARKELSDINADYDAGLQQRPTAKREKVKNRYDLSWVTVGEGVQKIYLTRTALNTNVFWNLTKSDMAISSLKDADDILMLIFPNGADEKISQTIADDLTADQRYQMLFEVQNNEKGGHSTAYARLADNSDENYCELVFVGELGFPRRNLIMQVTGNLSQSQVGNFVSSYFNAE